MALTSNGTTYDSEYRKDALTALSVRTREFHGVSQILCQCGCHAENGGVFGTGWFSAKGVQLDHKLSRAHSVYAPYLGVSRDAVRELLRMAGMRRWNVKPLPLDEVRNYWGFICGSCNSAKSNDGKCPQDIG